MLGVQYDDVVSEYIKVVEKGDDPAFAFSTPFFWNEGRFLKRCCWGVEVGILDSAIPGVVANAVEETSGGRSTLLKRVRLRYIDTGLPEVVVLLRHPSVVDTTELAIGVK